MTNAADWQGTVGKSWAQEWQRTDTSFCELTPHLLAAISSEQGSRIVDIGCGAGELSLAIARARANRAQPSASTICAQPSAAMMPSLAATCSR